MKLNFLLAAAFVAAPVLAASSTTETHTSTKTGDHSTTTKTSTDTAKASQTGSTKTSKGAAPTMGADILGVAGIAGIIAAMAV
ncbi:hypothetical protein BKA59DRAFT_546416 [Fusarium tricinctum]|uniref:Uncharacterized protein n=1 Tax=Fusarium tricinctum TaxID=61284 RepID=A0A8K0W9Y9_9HYPO|nr:hypothetical protein BKA59DRAFT_546416 [Fusarium tricinctum]